MRAVQEKDALRNLTLLRNVFKQQNINNAIFVFLVPKYLIVGWWYARSGLKVNEQMYRPMVVLTLTVPFLLHHLCIDTINDSLVML